MRIRTQLLGREGTRCRRSAAIALVALLLAACGGGGGGGDPPPITPPPPPPPPPPAADSDGDGLSDADETALYGTSPAIADTDGDGESDGREIVDLGFDASVNPYRYNPLVADLPQLKIDIQTTPIIGATYTDSQGSSQTNETTRSQSQTTSTSTSYGVDVTVGVEATTGSSAGFSNGPSAEVSNSMTVSASTTVSFDQTNTQENQTAWSQMQAQGIEQSTATTGGYVRIGVVLSHSGHIGYTIQNLTLSATRASEGDDPFVPLGQLDFDSTQAWQPVSLGPLTTKQTGQLTFEKANVDVGTIRTLLTQSRSLTIEPGTIELVDSNGQAFAFREAEIASRTAKVLIDYGAYAVSELYQVATNSNPGSPGRTLDELLNDVLLVDYTEAGGGLATVRAAQNPIPGTSPGRWVITRKRNSGTSSIATYFDPAVQAYTVGGIDVRSGDEVLLVFLEDSDGDGIGYREEILHGTDPGNPDTDGDGLGDAEEIRESWTVNAISQTNPNRYPDTVFSSPLSADYDHDGLTDPFERSRGTDPYNPDTDGDSIPDNLDQSNGGTALYSDLSIDFGQRAGTSDTPTTVRVEGSISAMAPRVVAEATVDWQSDGIADVTRNTAPGGNPTLTIEPQVFDYGGSGTYTIRVDANDDGTPQSVLRREAQVVLTQTSKPLTTGWGYDGGWRHGLDKRFVADVNGDGFDDVVAIGETATEVALGSAAGLQAPTTWATGTWGRGAGGYGGVDTDPRFLVDLDSDGDLDIVGIRASDDTVRYGLNNGSSFDAPVDWIASLGWNAALDHAFLADVDGNGIVDFVHVPSGGLVTDYRTLNFALDLAAPVSDTQALVDANRVDFPVRAVDLDGDGCADLAIFSRSETSYKRSTCNGSGQFEARAQLTGSFSYNVGYRVPTHVREFADVNGDGLLDIVAFANSVTVVSINQSTPGAVSVTPYATWTPHFTAAQGWANDRSAGGRYNFNITPRYLADVNDDGFPDIVGFASGGAGVGINMLGITGESRFDDLTVVAPDFAISDTDTEWWEDIGPCAQNATACREYFPRMVGDIDGDGRADLIGMDQDELVYQPVPYVTQFQ
jgi:hypothetical protein